MEKSRLFALMQSLNRTELRELRRFLASPFFNTRPEVEQLFDLLRSVSDPKKPVLYARIAGKERAYDDQQMRLWMSYLLKAIEQYLLHKAFFADTVRCKTELTRIYRLRNMTRYCGRPLREAAQVQLQRPERNARFYLDEYEMQQEQYLLSSLDHRAGELNLQEMIDSWDLAYLAEKLRQACLASSHQNLTNTRYHLGLLPKILNYIREQDLLVHPAIAAYFYAYHIIEEKEQAAEFFPALKRTLLEQGHRFPQQELGGLYIMAINFCIKRYNAGDRAFLQDEFELYRIGLEQELFVQNNIISRYTYRNIVTIGLVVEAYDWVERFIHQYKSKLAKAHRLATFSLSLARLEYSRKNYDAALQHLQRSNYKEILLNLSAKTVMLKIFYELEEYDLLHAHLQAMHTFIRRKKVIGYHRENYLNLINLTRRLMEHNPYSRLERAQLHEEIQSMQAVAEKEWLLTQSQ